MHQRREELERAIADRQDMKKGIENDLAFLLPKLRDVLQKIDKLEVDDPEQE